MGTIAEEYNPNTMVRQPDGSYLSRGQMEWLVEHGRRLNGNNSIQTSQEMFNEVYGEAFAADSNQNSTTAVVTNKTSAEQLADLLAQRDAGVPRYISSEDGIRPATEQETADYYNTRAGSYAQTELGNIATASGNTIEGLDQNQIDAIAGMLNDGSLSPDQVGAQFGVTGQAVSDALSNINEQAASLGDTTNEPTGLEEELPSGVSSAQAQSIIDIIKEAGGNIWDGAVEGTADLGNLVFQAITLGQGPQLEAVIPDIFGAILNGQIGGTLVLGGGQEPVVVLGTGQTGAGRGSQVGVDIPIIGDLIEAGKSILNQGGNIMDVLRRLPSSVYNNLPDILAGIAKGGLLFSEEDKETLVGLGVDPNEINTDNTTTPETEETVPPPETEETVPPPETDDETPPPTQVIENPPAIAEPVDPPRTDEETPPPTQVIMNPPAVAEPVEPPRTDDETPPFMDVQEPEPPPPRVTPPPPPPPSTGGNGIVSSTPITDGLFSEFTPKWGVNKSELLNPVFRSRG